MIQHLTRWLLIHSMNAFFFSLPKIIHLNGRVELIFLCHHSQIVNKLLEEKYVMWAIV